MAAEAGEALLAGLKVLELGGGLSAAYCARQFALWGADVVVAEDERGSPIRRVPPRVETRGGSRRSLVWEYTAAGKRSLAAVDAAAASEACDVLLVEDADGSAPSRAALAELRGRRPELVVVRISAFGDEGPYAGHKGDALIVQALSGYLALNGTPDRPPLRAPGHLVEYTVGVNAFVAALAALCGRERWGRGDAVEVNGLETLASIIPFLRVQYMGFDKIREGGTEAGVRILPCADGWISMLVVDPRQQRLIGEVLDIAEEDWPADLYEGDYAEVVAKACAFLSVHMRRKTMDEVFHAMEARGVVCGRVSTPDELLRSEQLAGRAYFMPLQHPELGAVKFAGPAARLAHAGPAPVMPAPDRPAALSFAELGWEARDVGPPSTARVGSPLQGLRVLDLTQAWIGPFATLILADLGADVVKIESHRRPDVWRQASPNPVALAEIRAERVNRSHYFNSVNRNKRSLCLDLASDDGKSLFRRLVADADVVAENYTPRVMDRFGLGYAALSRLKNDLVMASFSGFGKSGPWSDYKTNGSAVEAIAGWDHFHRYPGGAPVLMGFYQADPICGLQMAALILASLLRRERTGEGEAIDGAMLDASTAYIGDLLLEAQLCGEVPTLGNRSREAAPAGVYPTQGADRWIAISVQDEAAWSALVPLTGGALEPWASEDLEGRRGAQDAIDARLSTWTAQFEAEDLMQQLQRAGIAAGVVRGAAESLDGPALSRWFKVMVHPDLGAHRYSGFPWRFSGCELRATLPPPKLGEHSEALLAGHLGLTPDEIATLKTRGVTGAVL